MMPPVHTGSNPALSIAPTISLRGITVRFGTLTALEAVDLTLTPGEPQAVVGENGAGKSTLMKVLFGLLAPQEGEILVNGTLTTFPSPKAAIAQGIGMVQQHFELIPAFTVAENILLGAERVETPLKLLKQKEGIDQIAALAEEYGLPLDPMARVGNLSVAAQQRVEILKALYRQAQVLILDEPTATLAPAEARELWSAVRRFSQAGVTVVFVTHKLEEVMANADRVTVLRLGKRVLSVRTKETDKQELATAMVGEAVLSPVEFAEARPPVPNRPVLNLKNLVVHGERGEVAVEKVSLTVYAGEIVGLAGVDGSGQGELLAAILGLCPVDSGEIWLENWDMTHLSIAKRRAAGIAYIPEDRHQQAVVLPMPCVENIVLGRAKEPQFSRWGWLKTKAIRTFFAEKQKEFDVRGAGESTPIRSLSGGNQQKLVLARELNRNPRLLIAAQPTRGLDFAASAFVHSALMNERNRGAAILLQSLDLAEVLTLADRVAVMLQGKIVGVLARQEATEARIGALMTGASPAREAGA
jgi:simple sugar transport system ATP-binding protein